MLFDGSMLTIRNICSDSKLILIPTLCINMKVKVIQGITTLTVVFPLLVFFNQNTRAYGYNPRTGIDQTSSMKRHKSKIIRSCIKFKI